MEIERQWSKFPGWFYQQDRQTQIALLAAYRVKNTPPAKIQKDAEKQKAALLRQRIKEYHDRDQKWRQT
jgi:hypothetical protein